MDLRTPVRIPSRYILAENRISGHRGDLFRSNPMGLTVSTVGFNTAQKALCSEKNRPACHIIVDREGHAYQLLSLKHRIRHAPLCNWRGLYPNDQFISLGFLNHGKLEGVSNEVAVQSPTAFKRKKFGDVHGVWEQFSNDQILALIDIYDFLLSYGLHEKNFVGHHELRGGSHGSLGVLPFSFEYIRENLMYRDWKSRILGYNNPMQKTIRPD